jgi:NADPH-dependent ferric siderophore reductase
MTSVRAPDRAANLRVEDYPTDPRYTLVYATVTEVHDLSPHLRGVRLASPDWAGFPFGVPDQWVKLFFPLEGQRLPEVPTGPDWYPTYKALPDDRRPPMRTYTVRRSNAAAGWVDIDMVLHGDSGPGSRWASRAAVGDQLGIFGPGGVFWPPRDAEWAVVLGDETALPAMAAICEQETAIPVQAFIEVGSAVDEVAIEPGPLHRVTWLPRQRDAGLVDALRGWNVPAGPGFAWLAGEAGVVKEMRRHLVRERRFPKERIRFVGYWRRGFTEDEAE